MKNALMVTLSVLVLAGAARAHTDLTPAEVKAWTDTAGSGVLVDVRELSEYCDSTYVPPGHIPGAVNMPWTSGYFQAHYEDLPADEDIVLVCRSGNRSNQAADFLDDRGYTRVFDMEGGMNAWTWETENCAPAGAPRGDGSGPPGMVLEPACPSPFRSSTVISFDVPGDGSGADIGLRVYDVRGHLVATLIRRGRGAPTGRVVWDGADDRGRRLRSGVYFYRLTWEGRSRTRRVVLLR